ncbi:hypothetical protein GNF10_11585 [Nostoc sp. UCD121]|uniref:hypothetical protein n=1 Tax=unclassified Nostoc TaxID=2593658 RepID=UPI001623D382|nr:MULTISPECIES: hypothetical protein [unclassified Nostoc]MBC1221450.1 hypothetical protein [Nostoc sp. UCD120]MBC1276612.1 hypothetical protein [Nostoc sp. UCD121]MBC1294161.1 hypothetical protein [Nostoc sp. UCD122]
MKNLWQNLNIFSWGLLGATLVLQPTVAQAQYIQRSFLNPGFESPTFGSTNQQCYVQVNESLIPGWSTTHGSVKAGTGNCTGYTSPGSVPLIEIWTSGFNGVSTATTPTSAGKQFAELNAEQASELYQNLCLLKDETITFSFLHRGRSSATVADVANFLIGANTVFGTFSTTSNGTVTAQPVAQNSATIPTVTNNNAGNGWVRYSGTVPYTAASANQPVGFAAVSTAGGNNTVGNFLDEVQFAGKPVVEFTASSGGAAESETTPTTNPPKLRIVGLVPTGGISVPISVSGTATLGTDYNTTSGTSTFNITIPAGNYDGSDATSVFTIPFTVINNNVPQGVRTIEFKIETSPSFFTSSTTTCGGSPTIASSYTIYDDDFLSGKIWDDADNSANNTFTNINTGSETGTNAGGLLNAILVDSNNKVLKTTPVAADGTYTFLNVPLNQSNVKIILSTTAGTIGNTAPTASLPPNWVNTSPLTTATFNTATNISSKDFGIEQLPNTNNVTGSTTTNPGGTNTVQVPTLSGTDPEDGNLGSGNSFKIVSLPSNGTLYYNGVTVTVNQVITNYDPTKLTVDPNIDGATTITFTVAAVDKAGKEDPTPATVTMPLTALSASKPQLILVKRITRINSQNLTSIVDGRSDVSPNAANYVASPRDTDDDSSNTWPTNYLRGLINAGIVKPGDELEYTIYLLSNGLGNATSVQICDLVPVNTTFIPTAFNGLTPNDGGLSGAAQGIALALGSSTPKAYLTNALDGDRGRFYAANETVPSYCGTNINGAVVVNITRSPDLPNLVKDFYGFVRFRAKVK